MWPIPGPDLRASVRAFLQQELGLSLVFLAEAGNYEAVRFHTPRTPERNEALVTFANPNTRDAVKAVAVNLAGRSAVGIRIEVPSHLRANFRHLDNLCFELKKKYPQLKRNIRFDDDKLDLFADVLFEEGKKWKKMLPEACREAKIGLVESGAVDDESRELTAEDLSGLLSNTSQMNTSK